MGVIGALIKRSKKQRMISLQRAYASLSLSSSEIGNAERVYCFVPWKKKDTPYADHESNLKQTSAFLAPLRLFLYFDESGFIRGQK